VLLVCGPVQMTPWVRRTIPRVHRAAGYTYATAALITSTAGERFPNTHSPLPVTLLCPCALPCQARSAYSPVETRTTSKRTLWKLYG
jgi:hypothetical protein